MTYYDTARDAVAFYRCATPDCLGCMSVEPGWTCPFGESCRPLCGDGLQIYPEEWCVQSDDGNTNANDGCSPQCLREAGWLCAAAGQTCTSVCGDGVRRGNETCDDGNIRSGDGCAADCLSIDAGYECGARGDDCAPVCGDGLLVGTELQSGKCDDGNVVDGDGCSSGCLVERGFECATPGQPCAAVCGDALVVFPAEECDDGNTANGDGCSAQCTVEIGYSCATPAASARSICDGVCGDGLRVGNELASDKCDDGNVDSGDGCSSACLVERGFSCAAAGQPCAAVCGDSVLAFPAEQCDDGNAANDDGCSAQCTVESGYSCSSTAAGRSICEGVCGDRVRVASEGCDDGNIQSFDGCSAGCEIEAGARCLTPLLLQSRCARCSPSARWSILLRFVDATVAALGQNVLDDLMSAIGRDPLRFVATSAEPAGNATAGTNETDAGGSSAAGTQLVLVCRVEDPASGTDVTENSARQAVKLINALVRGGDVEPDASAQRRSVRRHLDARQSCLPDQSTNWCVIGAELSESTEAAGSRGGSGSSNVGVIVPAVVVPVAVVLLLCLCALGVVILVVVVVVRRHSTTNLRWAPPPRSHWATLELMADQVHGRGWHMDYASQLDGRLLMPPVGKGTSGVVYKARLSLGWRKQADVAVKQFTDLDDVDEWRNEVDTMARLGHGNIIRLVGACSHPQPTIVMEFAHNGTLRDVYTEYPDAITAVRLRRWLAQCVRGMVYLHSRVPSLLHRDLKAANLLLDYRWTLKISDLGIARSATDDTLGTVGGGMRGTVRWMAPELLRAMDAAGGRGDGDGDDFILQPPHEATVLPNISAAGNAVGKAPLLANMASGGGASADAAAMAASRNPALDVYSFGMTMWEVMARQVPFGDVSSDAEVRELVCGGARPPIGDDGGGGAGSSALRQSARMLGDEWPQWSSAMQQCWAADASARPSFVQLAAVIVMAPGDTGMETKPGRGAGQGVGPRVSRPSALVDSAAPLFRRSGGAKERRAEVKSSSVSIVPRRSSAGADDDASRSGGVVIEMQSMDDDGRSAPAANFF